MLLLLLRRGLPRRLPPPLQPLRPSIGAIGAIGGRLVPLRSAVTTHNEEQEAEKEGEAGLAEDVEHASAWVRMHLTQRETALLSLIADMLREEEEEEQREGERRCEPRIAGGWVRDKLLGRRGEREDGRCGGGCGGGSSSRKRRRRMVQAAETEDVDLAVNDATGEAFGERLVRFVERRERGEEGEGRRQGWRSKPVAVVQRNPAKSKHLETARVEVCGFHVDLVHLRNERYAADSRIPHSVQFGSPLEDALRRDFTINALFFNIRSMSIEDWTGHGLRDLETGLIRTPLPPCQTLEDDPLRALRGVRFAARFGFALEPEFLVACRRPHVRQALRDKVSTNRVVTELAAILTETRPAFCQTHDPVLYGLLLLWRTQLLQCTLVHIATETAPDLCGLAGELDLRMLERGALAALLWESTPSSPARWGLTAYEQRVLVWAAILADPQTSCAIASAENMDDDDDSDAQLLDKAYFKAMEKMIMHSLAQGKRLAFDVSVVVRSVFALLHLIEHIGLARLVQEAAECRNIQPVGEEQQEAEQVRQKPTSIGSLRRVDLGLIFQATQHMPEVILRLTLLLLLVDTHAFSLATAPIPPADAQDALAAPPKRTEGGSEPPEALASWLQPFGLSPVLNRQRWADVHAAVEHLARCTRDMGLLDPETSARERQLRLNGRQIIAQVDGIDRPSAAVGALLKAQDLYLFAHPTAAPEDLLAHLHDVSHRMNASNSSAEEGMRIAESYWSPSPPVSRFTRYRRRRTREQR